MNPIRRRRVMVALNTSQREYRITEQLLRRLLRAARFEISFLRRIRANAGAILGKSELYRYTSAERLFHGQAFSYNSSSDTLNRPRDRLFTLGWLFILPAEVYRSSRTGVSSVGFTWLLIWSWS